jgi:predicted MFS family arabinose efflux permease
VRMFAYAAMPAAWWVLPIHLLHGIAFSAMWVAGVANADALAPEGLGATAQGMFSAVTFGIGSATGALLGGLLYEDLGAVTMFRVAGIIVVIGLIFYVFMGRQRAAQEAA